MKSILAFLLMFVFWVNLHGQQVYNRAMILMGCHFEITVIASDSLQGQSYINIAVEEIKRIEKVISSWDKQSETSLINKNAGIKPIVVSDELFQLIKRAVTISKITDGAFDITYASMDKVWKFDGSMHKLPSPMQINASIKKIGYENIILNEARHSVLLKNKGMKIGFGAIGKGYAADKAKELLVNKGVKAGIINASGDLNTWGKQPDGTDWLVAITNPFNKNNAFGLLPVSNRAVVTSGNYEKLIEINGEKYTHIIDPRTGYPAQGLISVTVFAQSAELADALATSVFVMGKEGIDFIDQLPSVDCILIDEYGNVFKSENININENK